MTVMNQGNMTDIDYEKLRKSIIRCMVKDIRDGTFGEQLEDAKTIYRRYINLIVGDNLHRINEENMRMATDKQGSSPVKQLSIEEIVEIFFEKA